MTINEAFNQVRSHAQIDGALLGVLWTASFVCFIHSFSSPAMSLASMLLAVYSPIFAFRRTLHFRRKVLGDVISFRRALCYSFCIFLYAAIIFAFIQFIYFQFLDQGSLLSQYSQALQRDEFQEALKAYGVTMADVEQAISAMQQFRAIDVALNFFTINVFFGTLVSCIVALIVKRTRT